MMRRTRAAGPRPGRRQTSLKTLALGLLGAGFLGVGLFGGGRVGAVTRSPSAVAPLQIDIVVRETNRGSGTIRVTLAVSEPARTLVGRLRLDDLRGSAWAARTTPTGFQADTTFTSPVEATTALHSLGPPFARLTLVRRRSLLTITNRLWGPVDLTAGWAALSDTVVRQQLGSPLGVDVTTLAADLSTTPDRAIAMRLDANIAGRSRAISLPLGSATAVDVNSSQVRVNVALPLAISLLATTAIVVRSASRLRRPRRGGYYEETDYDLADNDPADYDPADDRYR